MRNSQFIAIVAATMIGTAALGAFVSTADAAFEETFDKFELKCRKSVAKSFLKTIAIGDKVSLACHKTRDKDPGQIATDCNDLGPAPGNLGQADPKGKFAKLQQKLIDTPAKKCVGIDDDVRRRFISCPEPCNTTLALANPLTDWDGVTQCMACLAGEVASTKNTAVLGAPDPALLSGDDQTCRIAIGKGYAKYLSAVLKSRTKCQGGADKNGATAVDVDCQTSPNPDGKGKIAKALLKAEGFVDDNCGPAALTTMGSCATTNLNDLKACLLAASSSADVAAFPAHYQFDATVCPTGVRTTVRAGNGLAGPTVTRLDVGFQGFGHGFDLPDGYSVVLDAACGAGSPPCDVCPTDGIRMSDPNSQLYIRCTNDFSVKCDEPFALDMDDCGGSPCTYVLGPPVPVSAGGVPSCTINALASDLTGTGNVETGEAAATTDFLTRVFLGLGLTQPCPVCNGDIEPGDGIPNGTCNGGSRDGEACDTLGYDATFASLELGSGLSLDCAPAAVTNVSGGGLKIKFELTTGNTALGANVACDSPLQFENCFCQVCSGDTTLPCNTNAECAAAAAGTCTHHGSGVATQPNGCNSTTQSSCDDIGNEQGTCSDASDMWCEGLVKANGTGFIGCLNNNECINASFVNCPDNNCGPCTLSQPRSCFLDPIETTGVADVNDPVLGGTFCVPPTLNPGINGASGLPGPGRVTVQQLIQRLYE